MTDHIWWACRQCGAELYNSQAVHAHRRDTGHVGAALLTTDVPTAGPGSSDTARQAAKEAVAEAIRAGKVAGGRA